MTRQSGQHLLHYRLVEKIGQGGMGSVWRARDTTLDRDAAIKILPDALAGDSQFLARFEREAKLLASLNHPNLAAVFGVHDAGSTRFLAMELVPGQDLSQRLQRGPLPMEEVVPIMGRIADALEAAHRKGVIHRDLKPANVRLTPDGRVMLSSGTGGDPVFLADANGANPEEIPLPTEDGYHQHFPTWSPDGRWIYLVRSRGTTGELDLWRVRPDGTGLEQLTEGLRFVAYPVPIDAKTVLFIHAVTPAGKQLDFPMIRVSVLGQRARFLPDGSGLVFLRGLDPNCEFRLLDFESGRSRPLTKFDTSSTMRTFEITPDGKTIVFDRQHDNSDIVLIERDVGG